MTTEDLELRICRALDVRRRRGEPADTRTIADVLDEIRCQVPARVKGSAVSSIDLSQLDATGTAVSGPYWAKVVG